MSFEELENHNNNNITEMSVKKTESSVNSTNKAGDKTMATSNDKLKINGGKTEQANLSAVSPKVKNGADGKMRLISSSDSGKGTGNEQNGSDDKSEQSQQTNSDGHLNGENIESGRSRSNSSDGVRIEDKLLAADAKYNKEEIIALLEPVSEKQLPSQTSESENHSRTVSWVNNHGSNEQRQFYNHLDVKKFYMKTRGPEFMNQVFERMNARDRYTRRVNYDPDQPAAGTKYDMEYKFYLDKMSVKKLIGLHGENSEMIRAVNQVDFYVSKDQDACDKEIVTIRGHWDNVRPAVADIQSMMKSVGKFIDISHINTAVNPNEFLLQNVFHQYLRIRLNNLESVNITGAIGATVTMQNITDYRYSRLTDLDRAINEVYGTPNGWKKHNFDQPPERVPLPINDFSIVVAPDEQGKYYRAIVEGSDIVTGECDIWFLDWGGRTTVSADKLYKMHNSFTDLPYVCLVGNLAGCQVSNQEEMHSFGRFMFQFIRRHMPVKVKAVNMDQSGHYTVLLYGNGGECINHLLIDNKWVQSVPYCTFHPFVDDVYVPAAYYDPETKEVLEFQYKAYDPYAEVGVYQQDGCDDGYALEQAQDFQSTEANGYRQPHRNDGNVNERYKSYPYRKYRYKYQYDYESESYRRSRNYHGEKRRPNGYRGDPQVSENYTTKGPNREEVEKPKGPSGKKNNQKATKPTEEPPKTQESNKQETPNPAAINSTTTTTTKTKTEATLETQVKAATVSSKPATTKPSDEPVKTETSTTTENKSPPETRTQLETAETTCATVTNSQSPSAASSNPWSSSRVSKSNIYKPKPCTEKSLSSQLSSVNAYVSTSAVSCNSSSTLSISPSKSSDKLSNSSTLVASNGSGESEPDPWTVVSTKRRSRRKGKY